MKSEFYLELSLVEGLMLVGLLLQSFERGSVLTNLWVFERNNHSLVSAVSGSGVKTRIDITGPTAVRVIYIIFVQ